MRTAGRTCRILGSLFLLGFGLAIATFAAKVQPAAAAEPGQACPTHPPVDRVTGQQWYADAGRWSVVDQERQRQHQDMLRPILGMMLDLGGAADRTRGAPAIDCAARLLRLWATHDALLQAPIEFNGTVERAQFARGLNIVALKLAAAGRPVDAETLRWLRRLTQAAMGDFERRGRVDNLYAWSGVNASSFLVLAADDVASVHERRVWERALAAIRPDGFVSTEAERGQRALIYHQYYLSALLMMRSLREARGIHATPEQEAALQRLAAQVSSGHCNPAPFAAAASGVAQEPPGPADQRIPAAMGGSLLTEAYRRCAPQPNHLNQPQLGGRLDVTQSLLEDLARRAPAR